MVRNKKVTIAIVGLGNRGRDVYAQVAKMYPEDCEIVAVADIVPEKLEATAKEFNLPKEACFDSAESLLKEARLADVMFVATQDKQHGDHAIPAMKKGYHILLEKPISPDLKELNEIVRVANETNRLVVVCHVLRYSPYYRKLKEIISSGKIGEIVTVMGIENVGYWHQAHSFVRGNWRNSEITSPMILQKCCHDMDILLWLTDKKCKAVSSFGSLYKFKPDMAPEGAAKRCLDGCKAKEDCPYDAEKIYITNKVTGIIHREQPLEGKKGWPASVVSLNPTVENVTEALKVGPYGRCVYYCDNDVVDHQVLNLLMTDNSTISFTMTAFTNENSRYTKFMGTGGDIVAEMNKNLIIVQPFGQEAEVIDLNNEFGKLDAHGGGDFRMVKQFIDIIGKNEKADDSITSIERSTESHYVALAAEESRINGGRLIDVEEFIKEKLK